MNYGPIDFSIPGVDMIAVLGRRYVELSDELIQQWLYELVRVRLVEPDYLLVTQETRHELRRLIASDLRMATWLAQQRWNDKGEFAERYPNKVTGGSLAIVVFPGLPEKTLFVGSLLIVRNETVQLDGPKRTITRTYAGLKEQEV